MSNCLTTPKSQKIYDFNAGRAEVIKRIRLCLSKPVIISVFGVPDSGKTELIDYVGEYFEGQSLKTRQRDNKEKINWYESCAHSDFEDTKRIAEELLSYDIIMYHCPWDNRAKPWKHQIDPEESVRRDLRRGLDFSVGIFNPKRSSHPIGDFNLVISNPASWEKPLVFDY